MPDGVLNAIKPLIDYRDVVDGVDYSAAVFIFLSNTGSHLINEMYHNYWENGRSRTSLTIADFEKMIQEGAFNEQGSWLSIFPYIDDIVNYIGKMHVIFTLYLWREQFSNYLTRFRRFLPFGHDLEQFNRPLHPFSALGAGTRAEMHSRRVQAARRRPAVRRSRGGGAQHH